VIGEHTGELSLFMRRAGDLVRRPPVTCAADVSAVTVARRLSREAIGSIVVVDGAGAPIGIVTDRDLRSRVVAEGRDPSSTPARDIMSAPLVALPPTAFAFEAVLEMTRHRIRHVVLVEEGRLVGVLSSQDFLALQTTHPVTLAREIVQATSVAGLAALARRTTDLVRRLVGEGGTPYDIGQIVAELNDRIVVRVLALAAGALEQAGEPAPPVPFCWLAFGSEARREQTLRTDQDNGLAYAEPPPGTEASTAAYYQRFAGQVIADLVTIGFPPCPGDAMASNPRWCQPVSVWAGYFRRWLDLPSPEEVLSASIYFDLRPLAGAVELAGALHGIVTTEAPANRGFLRLLANDVVSRRLPLTLFGNVALRRRGPLRGTIDVKAAGGVALTGAARLAALELGLPHTNTVDRIRAAAARGLYDTAEAREITDAHQHLMRLRLVHQLERLAAGAPADNDVVYQRLSRADALLFRDALRTVERVQAGIRERFATDLLG
jgi:CBS domain-containing protein